MKKTLSIILSLVLLLSIIPAYGLNAYAMGDFDKTEQNINCTQYVYRVSTYDELKAAFSHTDQNKTIVLTKNINVNDKTNKDYSITLTGDKATVLDMNSYGYYVNSEGTQNVFNLKSNVKFFVINTRNSSISFISFDFGGNETYEVRSIFDISGDNIYFVNYNVEYVLDSFDSMNKNTSSSVFPTVINIGENKGDENIINILGGSMSNYYPSGNVIAEYGDNDYNSIVFIKGGADLYSKDNVIYSEGRHAKYRISNATLSSGADVISGYGSETIADYLGSLYMDGYYAKNNKPIVTDANGNKVESTTPIKNLKNITVKLGSQTTTFDCTNNNAATSGGKYYGLDKYAPIIPAGHIMLYLNDGGYAGITAHTDPQNEQLPPTCTEYGYSRNVCSISYCGGCSSNDIISPHGHPWDKGVETTPATCTKDGVKTFTCGICHGTKTEPIKATGHKYTSTYTTDKKATTTADGSKSKHCANCSAKTSVTAIKKVSTVKLSATSYTYDGKVKSPTLTVKDSAGKALVKGTDYTVSVPTGRKAVGKYTYKITFKGNYSGTKSLSFTIVPKSTTISSLTAASKGFTVKWKKQATQTSGYQIRYSTSSSMASAKTVTVSSTSTVSKKITKLTAKKKYYVQVRTYKTVNGTKYYSSWSAKKYVTTKK